MYIFRFTVVFFILMSVVIKPFSQKGSIKVNISKDSIYPDEVLKIDFLLDNLSGNFKAPDFKGFQVVSGPNTSSSFIMSNGEINQKKTYSYSLLPMSSGTLEIGSASVISENNLISTDPISVYVFDNNSPTSKGKGKSHSFEFKSPQENQLNSPSKKRVLKKI